MLQLQALIDHTPVASALLAIIIVASLVMLYAAPRLLERLLFRPWRFIERGEFWSTVTSAFLHADLAHLFFNCFTFWAFAFPLERAIGSGRFLALYAFGLIASDLGTWLTHRKDPNYRTLGASGAILAVLFASIAYFPTQSLYIFPLPIPIPAPIFAMLYLAYTWWASKYQRAGVNHDAHFSGAIAGVVFVALTDATALQRAWTQVFG